MGMKDIVWWDISCGGAELPPTLASAAPQPANILVQFTTSPAPGRRGGDILTGSLGGTVVAGKRAFVLCHDLHRSHAINDETKKKSPLPRHTKRPLPTLLLRYGTTYGPRCIHISTPKTIEARYPPSPSYQLPRPTDTVTQSRDRREDVMNALDVCHARGFLYKAVGMCKRRHRYQRTATSRPTINSPG